MSNSTEDTMFLEPPTADSFLGERLQTDEIDQTRALIATLKAKVKADYTVGKARRDAHPKAHGCVRATLNIDGALPSELTGGVFQPGASYEAVVRFSNGSPNPKSKDARGDIRGMAVKLFGVSGEKLLPDPGNPDAQDFVMISAPYFFMNSARNYSRFFQAVTTGRLRKLVWVPWYLGILGGLNVFRMMRQKIANPLEVRYWSAVPYQLGQGETRQAVKYSVRPLNSLNSTIPANPDENFLRSAMIESLAAGAFEMAFMIQRRGETGMSVENSLIPWAEARAPFQQVGVLTIHKQRFDTPERESYCENLSFNPWHSLPDHRPLGVINRTRRSVYDAIAELRHQMNRTDFSVGMPAEDDAIN